MKKQNSKQKHERLIDMSSSDEDSSIETLPPEFKKSAFSSNYKVVE